MREKFQGRGRFWFDKAHYPEPVVGPSAHKSILHGCSACAAVAIKRRREIARYLGLLALFTAPLIHAADPFELIPREDPLSPEDSLAAFEIDGDYRLELVAAEPLVTDPVEICFDERGRIYVAEMRDYPLGVQEGNRPQSRIRLLEDTDGDGRMDTSTIWADEIAYAQGISLVNGGLLVTSWDAILFLKDTDGDDVADYQQTLYRTNEPRHSQAIVSSPRWGPGMQIHLNNGLDTKSIYDPRTGQTVDTNRAGIRLDPYDDWKLSLVEGRGQYGATFDELGNHFYTTNRNPIIMTVLPRAAIRRNPYSDLNSGQADVYPIGAKIYPAAITLTASVVHAGSYTAACGTHVYRGNALPDLRGHLLVCDPTAQIVSRHSLHSDGGTYMATAIRSQPQTEFIRSRDAWTRPVNLSSGPDGALYICDMYRRFIDHPMFLAKSYSDRFDMRTGDDLGRIYRLVPNQGDRANPNEALPTHNPERWLALLDHTNDWHRTTASRLIRESESFPENVLLSLLNAGDSEFSKRAAFDLLVSKDLISEHVLSRSLRSESEPLVRAGLDFLIEHPEQARVHEDALLALTSQSHPRLAFLALVALGNVDSDAVAKAMLSALKRSPNDEWLQSAVLSHHNNIAATILVEWIRSGSGNDLPTGLVARFSDATARQADPQRLSALIAQLEKPLSPSIQFAILKGVDSGLRFQKRMPRIDSLQELLSSETHDLTFSARTLQSITEKIVAIALDPNANPDDRVAAIELAPTLPVETVLDLMSPLGAYDQPAAIQSAALSITNRLPRAAVASILFDQWDTLGSTAQSSALIFLNASDATRIPLLERMKAGSIPKSLLDPMSRWRYLRSKNEIILSLARELYGDNNQDRQTLVSEYYTSLPSVTGDPHRGRESFQTNCALCHTFKGQGNAIGPDITDIRNKPLSGLLTDILDPNRVVETRFGSYQVDLKDGRSLMGLITEENDTGITLVAPGIEEEIPYNQITNKRATGLSLMPPGMENALDPQAMADLVAFLTH
jgi:putative membrane-bound dehydrogenase-like protein